MDPMIMVSQSGRHNENLDDTIKRFNASAAYKDLSTVILIPTLSPIPPRIVLSWMDLIYPPNQKIVKMTLNGMEVGDAYSQAIQTILEHPWFSTFRYILTLEADNAPPPDGLVKLLADMEANPQYACIGGLYWTKGEGGVPQIWGDPKSIENNYRPQPPVPGELVECCGTGMGFNVFRLDMFKDQKLRRPWFKTSTGLNGEGVGTQDLYFWGDARSKGYRCAIDCSVLVGHYDYDGKFGLPDTMW